VNVSSIPSTTLIGKALRAPLKLIPATTVLPILQGRLRGKRWIVGAGRHSYWLGSYEYRKRASFEQLVREGNVVFDVGGHVGFYTLLASVLVGPTGRVITFEPLPRNIRYLKEHLSLNDVRNVVVVEAGVADHSGPARFAEGATNDVGTISQVGTLEIRTVAIDDLVSAGELPLPDVMKIDVEGAEAMVLHGAQATLARAHPTMFLATHNEHVHDDCLQQLKFLGYRTRLIGAVSAIERSPEILAEYDG
jgi:FkbM family methyltransferase